MTELLEPVRASHRAAKGRNGSDGLGSFGHLPFRENDPGRLHSLRMRDEKTIQTRLEQLRGQLLQWGTPDLMVFTTTKDELRGWIRALEWVLARTTG